MSGWLPPGVTDADIDRAAPGYDDPLYYCVRYDTDDVHCSQFSGYGQCGTCRKLERERDLPCCWEKMSGVCMICGAGPDQECEVERERRRAKR